MKSTKTSGEWHHNGMAVMQLLVRDLPDGRHELDFAPSPVGDHPSLWEGRETFHVPNLGSPDLLKLTAQLVSTGDFRILELEVLDANLSEPGDELAAYMEPRLKAALSTGSVKDARRVLNESGPRKYYLMKVMLGESGGPASIEIGRSGFFAERPATERPDIRTKVQEAWSASGAS